MKVADAKASPARQRAARKSATCWRSAEMASKLADNRSLAQLSATVHERSVPVQGPCPGPCELAGRVESNGGQGPPMFPHQHSPGQLIPLCGKRAPGGRRRRSRRKKTHTAAAGPVTVTTFPTENWPQTFTVSEPGRYVSRD